jgi:SAM-dependent methyltransferase
VKATVDLQDSRVICTDDKCRKVFPLIDGVPILINDDNSVFAVADYCGHRAYDGDSYKDYNALKGSPIRRAYRRLAVWLTDFRVPLRYTTAEETLDKFLRERSGVEPECILIVGCGLSNYDERSNCTFVYTDAAFGPRTQYICDAHDLPFANGTFGMVIAVAILEHVVDPQRCVKEFHRVLRPGGWIYAATPFLQPVHMGAYDFTRFTHLGHRRLFRYFDAIDSGMALGPASALAFSLQDFLISFFTHAVPRKIVRLLSLILTRPLKYLDMPLRHKQGAIDAAGGTYLVGQKRETPIADRELIRQYRGLDGKPG